MLNISGSQYSQDPLLRQLSQHSSDNFDLEPPVGRTDPLLRQLNKNENIKVQNIQPPPQRLTNIFEAMGGANRVSFPGETVQVCKILFFNSRIFTLNEMFKHKRNKFHVHQCQAQIEIIRLGDFKLHLKFP